VQRKPGQAYVILLLVLILLCTAVMLRLLHIDLGHPVKPSPGILILVLLPAIKCIYDIFDKKLDTERRLLSVAALIPASLFLLSLYAPPSMTLWLLALAAVTLLGGTVAAFAVRRKQVN
jgi:hypothetical protein